MSESPPLPAVMSLPPRTITGAGSVSRLSRETLAFGQAGVIVHGASLETSGRLGSILAGCNDQSVRTWRHKGGEPTLARVNALVAFLRAGDADWVAAVGGGSVMDLAKAAAGLSHAPLAAGDYQRSAEIPPSHTPFIAVPTTAGTGSEATSVSVLTDTAGSLKKSIRHSSHMARVVILDGDLSRSCPPAVIAASGLDALTQAIESYISRGATWITDQCALKAVRMIAENLETVFRNPDNPARQALLEGSYLAGIALGNARLGLVHGLAHPLGARFGVPHGLACAVCLPLVLAYNRPVVERKYQRLSGILGLDVIQWVERLLDVFGIDNPLAGVSLESREAIVTETLASGSTKANPRDVSPEDVRGLLNQLSS